MTFRYKALAEFVGLIAAAATLLSAGQRGAPAEPTWRFAVSGDSRNCGDVVVPGIAEKALHEHPAFYWHLGDFRRIYDFDEDFLHDPEHRNKPLTILEYERTAWDDFLTNQVESFGTLPVFLGIGNHETIPPKTREEFIAQFADWLDSPPLRAQRLADNPRDHRLRIYYHWIERGVDFISLDNASDDQFDSAQVAWFEAVVSRDAANPDVRAIVVGMHKALPDSISAGHSMNESPAGTESGRRVYRDLLKAANDAHKHVYVLASHSHFYMAGIFATPYWKSNGGVLPGWIVGTAGAVRYPLPPGAKEAQAAETNVYGYLLATVRPDGEITFEFRRLNEEEVPAAVVQRYTPDFVHWCFDKNSQAR